MQLFVKRIFYFAQFLCKKKCEKSYSPENFYFDSIYFHMSDSSSKKFLSKKETLNTATN